MSPIAVEMPATFGKPFYQGVFHEFKADAATPAIHDISHTRGKSNADVAIVGFGCRLPGAATNPQAFWDMLMRREHAHGPIPKNRFDAEKFLHPERNRSASMTTGGGYFLRDDPTEFEPQLFNMNPTEAASLDPALKKLLEVTFETIESAGIPLEKLAGSNTGCYVGSFNHDELFSKVRDSQFADSYAGTSAIAPFLANRISYIFDLHGPSMTVDTACSASFYALHLACQAIRCGEVDSAIVASSNLVWSPDMQMFLDRLGALSPTSQCHVFGADADGYGRADGFVGFFLKNVDAAIKDGDAIHAVIKGTAVNSNGRTGGITHPSPKSQQAAMRQAYRIAGNLDPNETAYYECHGTGTAVGDPLEIKGIQEFFSTRTRDNPLLLGSVKTNIGHGEPVSGLSGLLKAVLAIKAGIIPPMITPEVVNPDLNLDRTRFKLLSSPHEWPRHLPRRASIASSGFGGANAHAIVEEYIPLSERSSDPLRPATRDPEDREVLGHHQQNFLLPFSAQKADSLKVTAVAMLDASGCYRPVDLAYSRPVNDSQDNRGVLYAHQQKFLLPFSAHKADSLRATAAAILEVSERYRPIDLAYTLGVRRSRLLYKGFSISTRNSFEAKDSELRVAKRLRTTAPRVGFVFTGQGAQWPQMGKDLFRRFPVFHESIDRMARTLKNLSDAPSWDLKEILLAPKSTSKVYSAEISQPACTALQIAIVAVLKSWEVVPTACIGHSSGEVAAAYAAGLIAEEEAIVAAYYRGKAVGKLTRQGAMIAVGMGNDSIQKLLEPFKPSIQIAAVNSPESVTVSGDTDAIEKLSVVLTEEGVFNRILATGGKAYHSDHMTEVGGIFETSMERASCSGSVPQDRRSTTEFFSSVLGNRLPENFRLTPSYWRQNLESPVLFSPTLSHMVESGIDHLVEIGPHSALAGPIRQLEQDFRANSQQFPLYSSALIRGKDGEDCMLELAGLLFNDGADINLGEVNKDINSQSDGQLTPTVLCDLPTYQYAYGLSFQHTNRLDREFRYPQHAYDDLLGSKVHGSSPSAPVWRNILTEKQLPTLGGVKFLGSPLVPNSCFLAMALRAAQQVASCGPNLSICDQSLAMRDIKFSQTLTLDEPKDVVTSLQEDTNDTAAFYFQISSINNTDAIIHCSGKIIFKDQSTDDRASPRTTLTNQTSPSIEIVPNKLYRALRDTGLAYDECWQVLGRMKGDPLKGFVKCDEIKSAKGLSSEVGLIEAGLQLAALAATPFLQTRNFSLVRLIRIDEIIFIPSEEISGSGFSIAQGQSDHFSRVRFASANVSSCNGAPAVLMKKIAMEEISDIKRPDLPAGQLLQSVQKLNFEELSQHETDALFPAPPFPGVGVFNKVHKLASAMVLCFMSRDTPKPQTFCEAGKSLLEWLESASVRTDDDQIPYAAELAQLTLDELSRLIESLYEDVATESVEARLMMRMYRSLFGVLEGTVSAHDLLLNDGLLGKLYTSTFTASGSITQLRRLVDLVGHKNPSAKYLEIGGGTRGATREVLDVLGAWNGPRRYSSYCFTDVSSYFLSGARDEFRECGDICYATLNIESSPLEQGFEANGYDVIVAANVLHATSSIQHTLNNARMLLKPGGKLILVETVRSRKRGFAVEVNIWQTIETVWLTIVLGGFADYWKGHQDGRPTSPFISVDEWSRLLRKTGFTAPEIDLPDYESPFRTMNVLLATATGEENEAVSTTGRRSAEIERFYPVAPIEDAKNVEKQCATWGTPLVLPANQPFVLVDALQDSFFVELTLWLVESGVRCLILTNSHESATSNSSGLASAHIDNLRHLGIQIDIVSKPLTEIDELDLTHGLSALTSGAGGLIFCRQANKASNPHMSTDLAKSHRRARDIFAAACEPKVIIVLLDSEYLLPSASQYDADIARVIRNEADSWSSVNIPSFVLSLGLDQEVNKSSLVGATSFDEVVPQLRDIFGTKQEVGTHAACFMYGMSPSRLATSSISAESISDLSHDERWSVLLQARDHLTRAHNNQANKQDTTPKSMALARFESSALAGGKGRYNAAIDAVAEVLAEILFLPREQINVEQPLTSNGIDSLVASELKSQLKQCFGQDVKTGWLLSGEVTLLDIADSILNA